MLRTSLLGAFVALLMPFPWSIATGQGHPFASPDDPFHHLTLTTPSVVGSFGRLLHADVDGDDRPDLVLRQGGGLAVLFGPAVYSAPFTFEISLAGQRLRVLDVAILDVDWLQGVAADSLLLLHDAGLARLDWNGVLDQFDVTPLSGPVEPSLERIACADLNLDGKLDLVGVGNQATEISILWDVLGSMDVECQPPVPQGGVFDFVIADFVTASPEPEVVLITTRGCEVYRPDGTELLWLPFELNRARLASFEDLVPGKRRIAFHGDFAALPGVDHLFVGDEFRWELPQVVGVEDPAALAVGDVDGDGKEDVVLRVTQTNDLTYCENAYDGQPATATFASTGLVAVPCGLGGLPAAPTRPLLADLDNDADVDVMASTTSTGQVALLRNKSIDHFSNAPSLPSDLYYDIPEGTAALTLWVDLPDLAAYTNPEIESLVYWRADASANIDPQARRHDFFPCAGSSASFTVAIDTEHPYNQDLHYICYRIVDRDSSDRVLRASPDRVVIFATGKHDPARPGTTEARLSLDMENVIGPGAGGGTEPTATMPCFVCPPNDDAPTSSEP